MTGYSYRAFVDINPKGKGYVIEPIPFKAGSASQINFHDVHPELQVDRELTKEVQGKTVEFKHD